MVYFEDVDLGDEIGPLETEATDDGVVSFCTVWQSQMPNRFTDREIAEQSRPSGAHSTRHYVNGHHGAVAYRLGGARRG